MGRSIRGRDSGHIACQKPEQRGSRDGGADEVRRLLRIARKQNREARQPKPQFGAQRRDIACKSTECSNVIDVKGASVDRRRGLARRSSSARKNKKS